MIKSTILSEFWDLFVNPLSTICGIRYFAIKEVTRQREDQSLAVLYKKMFSKFHVIKYFSQIK